ncbi:hypothetical protein KR215_008959, partial [Drosophila sulfurigaster]
KRNIFLLLFYLLIPTHVLNNSLMMENGSLHINVLKNIIQNVLNERSADTLLLLKRGHDFNCPAKDINIEGLPILRLDESTVVPVKFVYNSQAIAVVCMSELADSIVLTLLAKDLDRMRDARIIIWLEIANENLEECLIVICDYARKYNFVNLIVLHSSNSLQQSIAAYRLQPFPNPTLEQISNIFTSPIFPKPWRNFHNKSALIIPSLYPPASYVKRNRKSGKLQLSGHMDILMFEFAKMHNIHLRLRRPLSEVQNVDIGEGILMILNNTADLTMSFQLWRAEMECTFFVDMAHQVIITPCGKPIGIGDVYKSLKNFMLIILVVYLIISLVTTLVEAATCRIFRRRYRFSYGNLFVNLNALRWVLGISSDVHRDRRSMSLHQIVMVMGIFSMIVSCFFNANLSTFLTKRPHDGNIKNFKELEESRLPVIYDEIFSKIKLSNVIASGLVRTKSQIVFVPNNRRIRMILAQNTSNAYHTFDKLWDAVKKYQHNYQRVVLCSSPGLRIFSAFPCHSILPINSIYYQALNNFIMLTHETGLNQYWILKSINQLIAYSNRSLDSQHPTPLNYDDLKWVWYLLGSCYVASIVIFIGELLVNRWQ